MIKKAGILFVLMVFALLIMLPGTGCQPAEDHLEAEADEEQVVLEDEGILVGQIDSQSVEIEIDGQPKAFALDEGVGVAEISDGSKVAISYREEGEGLLLQSIEVLEEANKVLEGQGVYTGQSDSRAVEIEFNEQPTVFAIGSDVEVDNLVEGSRVVFTYEEREHRPVLLSIEIVEAPIGDENGEMEGEGILEGQIDPRSVEIKRNRVFELGEEAVVTDIEDGSKVAFTFTESEHRPVLDFIEAVDEPLEGEIIHGTLTGLVDSQSVEIKYYRAYALGPGVSIEHIEPGSEITFTYQEGPHRPELTSVNTR